MRMPYNEQKKTQRDIKEENTEVVSGGRGWNYVSISKGTAEAERGKEGFSPRAFRGSAPCWCSGF